MPKPTNPKMYVILREDLAFKYIQGGHALAQFALEHYATFTEWNNSYLINLAVFNGQALKKVNEQLANIVLKEKCKMSIFVEPDLESELPTAICIFEDGTGYVSQALRNLKLATK